MALADPSSDASNRVQVFTSPPRGSRVSTATSPPRPSHKVSRRSTLESITKRAKIPTGDGTFLDAMWCAPAQVAPSDLKLVLLVHGFAAEKTENGLFLECMGELRD